MKHLARTLCLALALALVCSLPVGAAWDPGAAGVELNSAAVYLENLDTGTVIFEKNADERRRPASLTKMMTCLIFLESEPDLNEVVTVPAELQPEFDHILKDNGADVGLKVGEQVTLKSLLYSAIIPSANDATTMLAWYLSDGDLDAFYDRMNERAVQLGCTDTHFICCHGLYETDEGNWSTARDIAKIAAACAARPDYMAIASTAEAWLPFTNLHPTPKPVPEGVSVPDGMWLQLLNTNAMLHPDGSFYRPYIEGVKTGYTDEAAFCFATTATVGGARMLLVELGCPYERVDEAKTQRIYQDTAALLDWAAATFTLGEAVNENLVIANLPVLDCETTLSLPVYPAGSITTLLDKEAVRYELDLALDELQAPITAGQTVGTARVIVAGETVGTVDLVVRQDCDYSSLLHLKNNVKNWWNGLFGK